MLPGSNQLRPLGSILMDRYWDIRSYGIPPCHPIRQHLLTPMAPVRAGRKIGPEMVALRTGKTMSSLGDGTYKMGDYPASRRVAVVRLSTDCAFNRVPVPLCYLSHYAFFNGLGHLALFQCSHSAPDRPPFRCVPTPSTSLACPHDNRVPQFHHFRQRNGALEY